MQLCDLEDLYSKFDIIKMLRIGSVTKPHFSCSNTMSPPVSDGDIQYEKTMNETEEQVAPGLNKEGAESTQTNRMPSRLTASDIPGMRATGAVLSSDGKPLDPGTRRMTKSNSMDSAIETHPEKKTASPTDGSFEGPLTKCLEEDDDILFDADRYVPNSTTVRIKVYLPNKKPLFIVVKKDATVQDTIEMTIRKSNALAAAFQKEYEKRKECAEKALQEKKQAQEKDSVEAHSPPLDSSSHSPPLDNTTHSPPLESTSLDSTARSPPLESTSLEKPPSPRHDSFDSLKDLLDDEPFSDFDGRRARRDEPAVAVRVDDIKGVEAMPLLPDSMAYELRMAVGDGECDMDFPALERGGMVKNFLEDDSQGFCVVPVPDYQPRSTTPTSMDQSVDIRLMFDEKVFNLTMPATSTCRQLLNEARHLLYPGRVYELTVAPEDKERLKMMSDVVNENTRLCDMDVTSFRIRLKHFYDGPKIVSCPTYSYNLDNSAYDDGVDLTSYMFTNFEAGKYKEWPVVCVTSKGKRRKRIFAIDRDEVFVYPLGSLSRCGGCCSANQTTIFISNILAIIPLHNPPDSFELKYEDIDYNSDDSDYDSEQNGDDRALKLRFETMTVSDCCEIVNRLEHLMRNSH